MKRLSVSLMFFIFLSGPVWAEGGPDFGLAELVGAALGNSEAVMLAQEEMAIAEAETQKARALLLPRASVFGDYTRYSESRAAFGGAVTVQPEWSTSYGARLEETLSLGGREIYALRSARRGAEKAGYDLYAAREDFALRVANSYYGLLRANASAEIAAANLERLKKHREAASARLRAGEATKTALLRAEAELSAAQSAYIKTKNAQGLSMALLSRLTGIKGEIRIRPEDIPYGDALKSCISSGGKPAEVQCLKSLSFAKRAELKSLALRENIAGLQAASAKGAFRPFVSLEANYINRESGPSASLSGADTIFGMVRLSYPFFEGGLRKAELRQAASRKRQAGLALQDARETIALQVEEAYLEVSNQKELLESSLRQLAFARDNFAAVSRQFELGLSNSLDVMDANALLVLAESQSSDSELGLRLSVLRLLRAAGILLNTLNIPGSEG